MDMKGVLRAGMVSAIAGALLLVVMAVLGFSAGESLGAAELPAPPEVYLARIRPGAAALIRVLAVDNIFLIAYTGVFAGAAALVWEKTRLFGLIGLGFAVLTALLDILENAILVDVGRTLLADLLVPPARVSLLSVVTQVKFAGAALAVAFFALAILITRPTSRPLDTGVAVLFALFPVVNALAVVTPSRLILVILWMLLMLLASAVLFHRAAGNR